MKKRPKRIAKILPKNCQTVPLACNWTTFGGPFCMLRSATPNRVQFDPKSIQFWLQIDSKLMDPEWNTSLTFEGPLTINCNLFGWPVWGHRFGYRCELQWTENPSNWNDRNGTHQLIRFGRMLPQQSRQHQSWTIPKVWTWTWLMSHIILAARPPSITNIQDQWKTLI